MKPYKIIQRICILALLVFPTICFGQLNTSKDIQIGRLYLVKLIDETELKGKVISKDSFTIKMRTESLGILEINLIRIDEIIELTSLNYRNGVYWFNNPNSTQYVFTTSAYNLEKGEGYYRNNAFLINSVNFGITDHFSLLVGTELISLSLGMPMLILSPKIGGALGKKVHAAVGTLMIATPDGLGGVVYETTTFGNKNNNLSLGVGFGYDDSEIWPEPVVNISGMARASNRISLISENWIAYKALSYTIFTYGVRFMGKKISADLVFINNRDIATVFPIGLPLVNFMVKWDRKNRP